MHSSSFYFKAQRRGLSAPLISAVTIFKPYQISSTNLEQMKQCSFSSLPQSTLCLFVLLLTPYFFDTLLRDYPFPAAEAQGA